MYHIFFIWRGPPKSSLAQGFLVEVPSLKLHNSIFQQFPEKLISCHFEERVSRPQGYAKFRQSHQASDEFLAGLQKHNQKFLEESPNAKRHFFVFLESSRDFLAKISIFNDQICIKTVENTRKPLNRSRCCSEPTFYH